MDFTNRSGQPRVSTPAPQQNVNNIASPRNDNNARPRRNFGHKWFKISSVILLFSGTILVIAVLLFINIGSPTPESKYINKSEYQAVVLNAPGINGGQIWFGHIDNISSSFIHLTNIFYLQDQNTSNSTSSTSSTSTTNSYNLIKLGCEVQGPEDALTFNRSQVLYWDNLKSNGQVPQKIAQYYKENPNGQNCSNASTSNATSNTNNNTTTTTPSTTNTSTGSSTNSTSTTPKSSTSGQ